MIKLTEAVIVEGKYDKIRLSNIIDGTIIATDGFGIFKDRDKRELIRLFANTCGIIVITDSDRAGQLIRAHIKNIAANGKVTNLYLPPIKGKERRKTVPSAEGLLGVEGTDDEIIIKALEKAGLTHESSERKERGISKTDLFSLGLSGGERSREKREALCRYLSLPLLPANTLLDAINTLYSYNEFMELINKWKEETES